MIKISKWFHYGFEKKAINTERRKYREMSFSELNPELEDEIWSAKIDGAHTVLEFRKGQTPILYGHRISKKTGLPIEYTEKITHLDKKAPFDAVLRSELFVTKDNKVLGPEVVTSVLNSLKEKSLELQKSKEYQTNSALFDIDMYKGVDYTGIPSSEKLNLMKEIVKKYPLITMPDIAVDIDSKKELMNAILQKRHPQTSEGIVVWKGGDYIKAKVANEHDVYIRSIFKEESERGLAGGFEYSWDEHGPIVGKVGSGFDHATKKDMLENPEKYIGKIARVRSLGISANNALLKPSYQGLHVEKNLD